MGKCILSFDQIEIKSQKSNGRYSDNDWMVITWFVGDAFVRTDKFPLLSLTGGVGLKSGDGITPFTSEVDCTDDDIVTAAYSVVNLGSTDLTDQADAIAKIAEQISEALTQAYLTAVEIYLKNFSDLPFADLAGDALDAFAPTIVNAVGTAFDNVIIPLVNDVIRVAQIIIGVPNCNGSVFNDVAVFKPRLPMPDMTSSRTYTASSVPGCHGAASTDVSTTLHRNLDVPMQFGSTPLPTVYFVPSNSKTDWLDIAAEDATTNAPIVVVTIGHSRSIAGLAGVYAVTVTERVDSRFGAVFEASADGLSVQTIRVTPFVGNVPGTIRPWIDRPLRPGDLMVTDLGISGAAAIGTKSRAATKKSAGSNPAPKIQTAVQSAANQYAFTLGWQTVQTVGFSPTRPVGFPGGGVPGGISDTSAVTDILEHVNVLQIPARGVTICLYELQLTGGDRIAYALRYMRAQNFSYTNADWELVKWNPVK
jgi:hypothetical protein